MGSFVLLAERGNAAPLTKNGGILKPESGGGNLISPPLLSGEFLHDTIKHGRC